MNSSSYLLIVFAVIFSVSHAALVCPTPPRESAGICVNFCEDDNDCRPMDKCCLNGCGHVCTRAEGEAKCRLEGDIVESETPWGFIPPNGKCPPGTSKGYSDDKVCCTVKELSFSDEKVCAIRSHTPSIQHSCGRGSRGCPVGWNCTVHAADRWSACCPADPSIETCQNKTCEEGTSCVDLEPKDCEPTEDNPCYPTPTCLKPDYCENVNCSEGQVCKYAQSQVHCLCPEDPNGRSTCDCGDGAYTYGATCVPKSPVQCPNITDCPLQCDYGYTVGQNGCEMCHCKPPGDLCRNMDCDYKCVMEEVSCFTSPCYPVAKCIDKPVECNTTHEAVTSTKPWGKIPKDGCPAGTTTNYNDGQHCCIVKAPYSDQPVCPDTMHPYSSIYNCTKESGNTCPEGWMCSEHFEKEWGVCCPNASRLLTCANILCVPNTRCVMEEKKDCISSEETNYCYPEAKCVTIPQPVPDYCHGVQCPDDKECKWAVEQETPNCECPENDNPAIACACPAPVLKYGAACVSKNLTQCPQIRCSEQCDYGRTVTIDGCDTCECKPPGDLCRNMWCNREEECKLKCEPHGPCHPQPMCVKKLDVCLLPVDEKSCNSANESWVYNTASGQCDLVNYGGCDGTFKRKQDCEDRCPVYIDSCYMPADLGSGEENLDRWRYNYVAKECVQFAYSGSGGNENNFATKGECESTCPKLKCKSTAYINVTSDIPWGPAPMDGIGCPAGTSEAPVEGICCPVESYFSDKKACPNPDDLYSMRYECGFDSQESCPVGWECSAHALDAWAVCCPKNQSEFTCANVDCLPERPSCVMLEPADCTPSESDPCYHQPTCIEIPMPVPFYCKDVEPECSLDQECKYASVQGCSCPPNNPEMPCVCTPFQGTCVPRVPDCRFHENVTCAIECDHGRTVDGEGCPLCRCNPAPDTCRNHLCPVGQICVPQQCDEEGGICHLRPMCVSTRRVPRFCAAMTCLRGLACLWGQLPSGCAECDAADGECEPCPDRFGPVCAPIASPQDCGDMSSCGKRCAHGNAVDSDGCPVCECNPPPDCPTCSGLFCEYSNSKDESGCPLCQCVDPLSPCHGHTCDDGYICAVSLPLACPVGMLDCQRPEPVPQCIPKPVNVCENHTCPENQKCVSNQVQCIRAPCPPLPSCVPENICVLPPETGPCEALMRRWYYNSTTRQCTEFTYGGCDGNENNFDTKDDCDEECPKNPSSEEDDAVCDLPIVTGPCKALFPSWGFNSTTGLCQQFNYGGCEGNDNRFQSESECADACLPKPVLPGCPNHLCENDRECKWGYRKDADGCNTCDCYNPCLTMRCPSGHQCTSDVDAPRCDNALTCTFSPEDFCVPMCPPVCEIYCDYGKKLDENGCETCDCNPEPATCTDDTDCSSAHACKAMEITVCPTCDGCRSTCTTDVKFICVARQQENQGRCSWTCDNECEAGFTYDIQGCQTCRCAPSNKPLCSERNCNNNCTYGYVVADNGCETCRCKHPCDDIRCGDNQECGLVASDAQLDPQSLTPTCVTKDPENCNVICDFSDTHCANGLLTDSDGCAICTCSPFPPSEYECQEIGCVKRCDFGFTMDDNGCKTCDCNPPTFAFDVCPSKLAPVVGNDGDYLHCDEGCPSGSSCVRYDDPYKPYAVCCPGSVTENSVLTTIRLKIVFPQSYDTIKDSIDSFIEALFTAFVADGYERSKIKLLWIRRGSIIVETEMKIDNDDDKARVEGIQEKADQGKMTVIHNGQDFTASSMQLQYGYTIKADEEDKEDNNVKTIIIGSLSAAGAIFVIVLLCVLFIMYKRLGSSDGDSDGPTDYYKTPLAGPQSNSSLQKTGITPPSTYSEDNYPKNFNIYVKS